MGEMKKVVVLGCGKIGKLVCHLLAGGDESPAAPGSPDAPLYAVTAVDANADTARRALATASGKPLPHAQAKVADFTSRSDIAAVLAGQDYVLSCAPYHCNVLIADVAKAARVHYLDLTEDVATTKAVKLLAEDSKLAFVPQCGLAPGFISIVAHSLAKEFDSLESVKMRVGALPMYPHNRLKYNLTWSTEGLINEYGNPCEAVINGKLTLVPPLEGLETFSLDGMEYEAFNTSGGLGTLAETWAGKVRALDYKSIRYPGHREIIALLMNDFKLNDDRETLKKIFESSLPHTAQDVVIIFVTASGVKDGRYCQQSYAKKIYNRELGGERWGAIQITTAAGICAVLDLHASGRLKASGFIKQEDVSLDAFLTNRFGRHYQ